MTITKVSQCFANNQNILSLEKFNIPVPLDSDNQSFFYNCRSLTSATLENRNNLTYIGANFAYGCVALQEVVIPDTVTIIAESAFNGCTSLTSVVLPASLSKVGKRFFLNCSNLANVTCLASTPPTQHGSSMGLMFDGCSENLVIYVPSASVAAYQAASGWSTYASRIQAIP